MALVTEDLAVWLREQSAVGDLVGDRVHAVRLQQASKMPAIVISLVSSSALNSTTGYSRYRERRFQFDIYSDDLEEVYELGEAVFQALNGFAGAMGSSTVLHSFLLSERDLDEDEVNLFRRTQDWEIAEAT